MADDRSPLGSRSILFTLRLSHGSSSLPQPLLLGLLGLGPVHHLEQLGSCLPVQSAVDCWGDLQPRLQHHLLSLQPDVLGPFNKPNPAIMLSSQRGG